MEKLVLTGTVCFCVGLTVGLILGAVVMALAVAAKKYKPKTEEIDDCWGCFGAEITDLNMLMIAVFYIGDCILMKTVRKENDNEK